MANDIVYFLKADPPLDGEEFRFSLRSLKNMPHQRVFVVAERLPEWVSSKVIHLDWKESGQTNKYYDLSAKWLALKDMTGMSKTITLMDDDMYVIRGPYQPFNAHNIPFKNILKVLENIQRKTLTPYDVLESAYLTYDKMRSEGIDLPLSPVQHIPWPVRRNLIPDHWDDGKPYDYKSLYYNYRSPQKFKHGEPKAKAPDELKRIVERGEPVISSDDPPRYQSSGLQHFLEQVLTEKCKYER